MHGGSQLFATASDATLDLRDLLGLLLLDALNRPHLLFFMYASHDVESEVQNSLQISGGDVEQEAKPARRALEIPDVADRRR